MGTCKIVEWCDNPKCLDGCLAQKAVDAEREACARIAETLKITINGQSITAGFGAWVADIIRSRSNDGGNARHDQA